MNWYKALKARGEIADRLAHEVPIVIKDQSLSLTRLLRLHWAVRDHANSVEMLKIEMIKSQALEELVLAAEALSAAFTEIADAIKVQIAIFGAENRSFAA
jgi:hypothetical protein